MRLSLIIIPLIFNTFNAHSVENPMESLIALASDGLVYSVDPMQLETPLTEQAIKNFVANIKFKLIGLLLMLMSNINDADHPVTILCENQIAYLSSPDIVTIAHFSLLFRLFKVMLKEHAELLNPAELVITNAIKAMLLHTINTLYTFSIMKLQEEQELATTSTAAATTSS